MKPITFLDCTLRDGGYYNNWDFDPKKSEELINSLNRAGVDIIEIGYKSPNSNNHYYGLFKYCNEDFLRTLSKNDQADYAFMLDVKQFVTDDGIDEKMLDEIIKPVKDSIFSWVRLASHYATINQIPALSAYFKDKGYNVCFNLMGGSLLSRSQYKNGLKAAKEGQVDVFYLADSFGSFYPRDIRSLMRFLKENYDGKIGIHTHDNQGLAYANTLAAIDEGVDFVDATVTGMGRGAGNLQTEKFLIGYADKAPEKKFNGNVLLPIIEDYIQPMKMKYKWGYNTTYMYSGLENIHPTYCQKLIEGDRYTSEEISGILASISKEERHKFNVEALEKAIRTHLKSEVGEAKDKESKKFDFKHIGDNAVVIMARGPQAGKHVENLKSLSNAKGYTLMECNDTGFLEENDSRVLVILNQVRLNKWLHKSTALNKNTIVASGFPVDEKTVKGGYAPFKIGDFDIDENKVVIPDYDAGIYAIALALKAGVKEIYLAGFDGFEDENFNKVMEIYFQQIAGYAKKQNVEITHITPTAYSVFSQQSIYEN